MKKFITSSKNWIYESPDGGKTIYRRPFGKIGPKQLIIYKTLRAIINLN